MAVAGTLQTQAGNTIALSVSSYRYSEPAVMSLNGTKTGFELGATRVLPNDQFVRGEFRYAFGLVNYDSVNTGSASGEFDWYLEARGLVGQDWPINAMVLSAYTGLGYRYLFNDGRGISSTGAGGYRRQSNYYYWPIGILNRAELAGRARLESSLEFDTLLFGRQLSALSDVGAGYGDVSNPQTSGYGLKMRVMYQQGKWSAGPYLDYWNIAQSDISVVYQYGAPVGFGVEPKNNTVEFGFRVSQQF